MNTTVLMDEVELPARPTLAASFAPLLAPWRALASNFNARKPRERALMTGVALMVVLAAVDHWLITPAYSRYREASKQQHTALMSQSQLHSDALQIGRRTSSEQTLKRSELKAWRERVQAGETLLQEHENTLVSPDEMMNLLEQMLGRHGKVQVRSVKQLEQVDLLAGVNSPAAATAATTPPTNTSTPSAPGASGAGPRSVGSLYRHGVELVLEGSYGDLLAYVRALESMPQHLLWGATRLEVKAHPSSHLTLQLYTVSRERHWLEF